MPKIYPKNRQKHEKLNQTKNQKLETLNRGVNCGNNAG